MYFSCFLLNICVFHDSRLEMKVATQLVTLSFCVLIVGLVGFSGLLSTSLHVYRLVETTLLTILTLLICLFFNIIPSILHLPKHSFDHLFHHITSQHIFDLQIFLFLSFSFQEYFQPILYVYFLYTMKQTSYRNQI